MVVCHSNPNPNLNPRKHKLFISVTDSHKVLYVPDNIVPTLTLTLTLFPHTVLVLRVRGGLWETQDVYGDRQAEAAAKRVQRPVVERSSLSKPSSTRRILGRTSKPTTKVRLIKA